jgi:hypothetical protein
LERAHHAYAAGDWRGMTRELLQVLESPQTDEIARANAIQLVDRAIAEGEGRLDSGFERPAGMTWMRLLLQHCEHDGTPSYRAILNAGLSRDVEVTDVRIVRARDERVLASKGDSIGYFELGAANGGRYFYIHSADAPFALESGVYRIEWAYADGRSGVASVLVPTVQVDAVPEILEPSPAGVAHSRKPTIRWKAPSWIGDKTFGQLGVEARVASGVQPWREQWSLWESPPTRTQVQVGAAGKPEGATLEAGQEYNIAVQYQWRLQYGELALGGTARAATTITVDDHR